MSDSLRPHGLQTIRLLRPLDFPGKSTGVGCHCLLRAYAFWGHKESDTTEKLTHTHKYPYYLSISFILLAFDIIQFCESYIIYLTSPLLTVIRVAKNQVIFSYFLWCFQTKDWLYRFLPPSPPFVARTSMLKDFMIYLKQAPFHSEQFELN